MRILYSFPHALGASGIGTTALKQVEGLARAGHDVEVFCTSTAVTPRGAGRVVRTLSLRGRRIPHRAVGGTDRAYRYHDLRVAGHLRRHGERYDVVHVWPLGGLRTLRTAADRAIPGVREAPNTHTANAYRVVAEECARIGYAMAAGSSHAPSTHRLKREEAEYEAASLVLAPSDHVAETFLKEGFDADRIGRHQYGYDAERFTAGDLSPNRTLRAIFLGRIEPRKGLHLALDAWAQSRVGDIGAQLVVYGDFSPGYEDLLGASLETPGIEVRGFTDDPARELSRSDALLLPSLEEGSALVTYEAMASGCGLLVSAAAGARMDHGVEGLVHRPGDVAALAGHLQELAKDVRRRQQVRHAAVRRAANLTWDDAAQRLTELYGRAEPRPRCRAI